MNENGKTLIANAIGEPLSHTDTYQEMSNDINDLLSTFRTNLLNSKIPVASNAKLKTLIDKTSDELKDFYGTLIDLMQECGFDIEEDATLNEIIELLELEEKLEIRGIKQLDGGNYHTVIVKNNDELWACGGNNIGQIGYEVTVNQRNFIQIKDVTNVKQVACGDDYTVILKNDGTLWACGKNNYSQLGLNDTNNRSTFTQVTDMSDVKQVSCGLGHTIALKNDGSLWACGLNNNGQLGLGNTNDKRTFTQVTDISDVEQVICTSYQTFIIKKDGTLWTCGLNNYYQLGLGHKNNVSTFTQVASISDVKQIACGYVHNLILKNDGSLWGIGNNTYGQLGLGNITNQTSFVQITTNINNDVAQVFCGGETSFIIKNDGTAWSCGRNQYGQLGLDVGNSYKNVFTQITTLSDVKEIICTGYTAFAIKNDGTLWSCGYNYYYQLGLDHKNDVFAFNQIPQGFSY